MSTLYLGSDPVSLAGTLGDLLEADLRQGDPFQPVRIVVPNRYLGKWLRLHLARRFGVAFNLHFDYLERTLWDLLRLADPRAHDQPPEMLTEEHYQLLVLSILLQEPDAALGSLRHYLEVGAPGGTSTRQSCRRAWSLAQKLASLVRDYEYHRQETLILPWLAGKSGLVDAPEAVRTLEAGQRCLFTHVVREDDGRRALLNQATGKNRKTLPQYAGEVMELTWPAPVSPQRVHLFGVTQVSALHVDLMHWLGKIFDLRVFHINPLVSQVKSKKLADVLKVVERYRHQETPAPTPAADHDSPLRLWGLAGAESLGLMARLLEESPAFALHLVDHHPTLSATKRSGATSQDNPPRVLHHLQQLLRHPAATTSIRLPQDDSLILAACPSPQREVETVHNAILRDLQRDPRLLQTDIAVLVTDMASYRPIIQTVFQREPRRLRYNLADYSAARLSTYAQGVVGMLDLALESMTRSRVLDVVLNPCFLTRLGVDQEQAAVWLHWSDQLGVFQGWDAADRRQRGQGDSPLFGWKLALERLRLGRFMDAPPDDLDRPAPRFGHVLPHADLHSQDRDQLDAFCRALEGLLPVLLELRGLALSGTAWAQRLASLAPLFLDVPAERPEEEAVRTRLLAALEDLKLWDRLSSSSQPLPLALVREFVQSRLESMEGSTGEYLTGGVTISALQPMRPVPFSIIYLVGMNESLFPGGNFLSTIDLRSHERRPGDILPAEYQRFLFLEALLAARQKLVVTYTSRDLQKDQELLPAIPLVQLQRYLNDRVLQEPFRPVAIPLAGHDARLAQEAPTDFERAVLVQYNQAEQFMALEQAQEQGTALPAPLARKVDSWRQTAGGPGPMPAGVATTSGRSASSQRGIQARDLNNFLNNPLVAAFRRHLHLYDERPIEESDDEPFVADYRVRQRLLFKLLDRLVVRAGTAGLDQALSDWPGWFDRLYDDWQLRSLLPGDGFAQVDRQALRADLEERLADEAPLVTFLRKQEGKDYRSPLLIGESHQPLGARWHLPALEITTPEQGVVRLSGQAAHVWLGADSLEFLILPWSKDAKGLNRHVLEPALLYLILLAHPEAPWTAKKAPSLTVNLVFAAAHKSLAGPGGISAAEARTYLAGLVRDFLGEGRFDHLPLDVLNGQDELKAAFLHPEGAAASLSGADYQRTLEEAIIDSEDEWEMPGRKKADVSLDDLAEMVDWTVPADAFDKVRRRLHLAARALGLVGQE